MIKASKLNGQRIYIETGRFLHTRRIHIDLIISNPNSDIKLQNF